MSLLTIGLSHHTAPLDLRGRFSIPAERLADGVAALRGHLSDLASEAAILSTCNRTEIYLAPRHEAAAEAAAPALDWLARQAGVPRDAFAPHVYAHHGEQAARHAFRVACGLDSMVLGEPQILGQLKRAVQAAQVAGGLGQTLHQLFQRSFSVAKAVRSTTGIGEACVSLAAATVRLAEQLFGDLAPCRVLCIGAGDMMRPVVAHFAGRRPASLVIANRTAARGAALAAGVQAGTLPLASVASRLADFDVVVSGTASPSPLIGLPAVQAALKARRRRPMLLVDLAVTRDIDPAVRQLDDAYLHTVDDLGRSLSLAGDRRRAAACEAEDLVEAGVREFGGWLSQRGSVPLIQAVQQRADDWRRAELERARRALARGASTDEVLEQLSRTLAAKLLHGSLRGLRDGDAATRDAVSRCWLREDARR